MNRPRLNRAAAIAGVLLAGAVVAQVLLGQTPQTEAQLDAALTGAATDFLERWVVQRDAATAVDKYLSPLVNDERLLPADAFTLSEYQERFAGERSLQRRPIDSQTAKKRMTGYLQAVLGDAPRQPLNQRFQVWNADAIARARLRSPQRNLQVRQLNSLALTYSVTSWTDLEWTNTGAIGWELLLPEIAKANQLDLRAIVLRLATGEVRLPRDPLVFMLWVAPRSSTNWQFFGLELPPVN